MVGLRIRPTEQGGDADSEFFGGCQGAWDEPSDCGEDGVHALVISGERDVPQASTAVTAVTRVAIFT